MKFCFLIVSIKFFKNAYKCLELEKDIHKISLVELPLLADMRAQFVSFPVRNLHISYSLILSAPRYQETNYKCPGSWNELWKLCVGNCEMGLTPSSRYPRTWRAPLPVGVEVVKRAIHVYQHATRISMLSQVRTSKLGHFELNGVICKQTPTAETTHARLYRDAVLSSLSCLVSHLINFDELPAA